MSLKEELRNSVQSYVNSAAVKDCLGLTGHIDVHDLAQGEYNLNYLIESGGYKFVFRVNTGSQMDLQDQIGYEYLALNILSKSGVTPIPYYLDNSKSVLPHGVLIMEYLPGRPLDYSTDLEGAAKTFARIHSLEVNETDKSKLVVENHPFSAIYQEANTLLRSFWQCERADNDLKNMFEQIMLWAEESKNQERYFQSEPWQCVINTEVNSHNFIINDEKKTTHLIDWEKPIYGEPAQDLSHFLIRTTTKWKRNYTLSFEEESYFLQTYAESMPESDVKSSLHERVAMFKPFIHLRAVSWCAMAWVEYTSPGRLLRNEDTFSKIREYLEPGFLKALFPFVNFKL